MGPSQRMCRGYLNGRPAKDVGHVYGERLEDAGHLYAGS